MIVLLDLYRNPPDVATVSNLSTDIEIRDLYNFKLRDLPLDHYTFTYVRGKQILNYLIFVVLLRRFVRWHRGTLRDILLGTLWYGDIFLVTRLVRLVRYLKYAGMIGTNQGF